MLPDDYVERLRDRVTVLGINLRLLELKLEDINRIFETLRKELKEAHEILGEDS